MARRIRPMIHIVGQPCAATNIAPSANGSAKIVCENRMNRSASASISSRFASAGFLRFVEDRRQAIVHAEIDQLPVFLRLVEIEAPAQGKFLSEGNVGV